MKNQIKYSSKKQYNQIKKCIYCPGDDMKCDMYASQTNALQKKILCLQTKVIANDMNKIYNNDSFLTYPVIKDIMKSENIVDDVNLQSEIELIIEKNI